jgi:hypothetical protein
MILKSTLITLALPLLISCTLLSCSKKEAEKQDVDTPVVQAEDTVYSDWLAYTYQNIKIIYPENHTLADDLYPMAMGYIKSSKQICNFLRIPVPEDTLRIYFYTGFGQGREMTGNEWPSVDGNNLHFWLPGFMGTTLTQYLLPKWHPEKPRYRFLKEGLMTLFDYSGQDYHEYTLNFIDEDRLVPLLELARDTAINAYKGSYPVAEAASFVAFFVDRYGIEGLNALYMSQEPFEVAVSKLFKTDVEAMQKEWLEYADRVYYESLRGK